MSDFAFHFRQHAIPRLRKDARFMAWMIQIGDTEFDQAYDDLLFRAECLGAKHLSAKIGGELHAWLLQALSEEALSAKEESERSHKQALALKAADPVAYYENLAAGCSNPEQMRWVFASYCPEYRRHLQATRGKPGQRRKADAEYLSWFSAA